MKLRGKVGITINWNTNNATFSGSCGQFRSLLSIQNNVTMVTIDEAHKILDCMPSYWPAFDDMKKLCELSCPKVVTSVTLVSSQVDTLKQQCIRSDRRLILTKRYINKTCNYMYNIIDAKSYTIFRWYGG